MLPLLADALHKSQFIISGDWVKNGGEKNNCSFVSEAMMSRKAKSSILVLVKHTPKSTGTHTGPTVGFTLLCQVFLEALKVTQQCKVASTWSYEVVLPPCFTTQPQGRTRGNVPHQSFILCSPRRQGLQALPAWVCHHINTGAVTQPVKCLCRATLSPGSLSSSPLSQQHRSQIPHPQDPLPSIKSSPSLDLPPFPIQAGEPTLLEQPQIHPSTHLWNQASAGPAFSTQNHPGCLWATSFLIKSSDEEVVARRLRCAVLQRWEMLGHSPV